MKMIQPGEGASVAGADQTQEERMGRASPDFSGFSEVKTPDILYPEDAPKIADHDLLPSPPTSDSTLPAPRPPTVEDLERIIHGEWLRAELGKGNYMAVGTPPSSWMTDAAMVIRSICFGF